MSRNNKNFFDKLKPWAKYKNFILDYYLKPYIEKTKKLNKPILLVDCCSGPGKFKDGNLGSPLIMAEHLKRNFEKGVDCRGIFIEGNKEWYDDLKTNLLPYSRYCEPKYGDFKSFWDQMLHLTDSYTVFVYIDPFGVKDLFFENFKKLLEQISSGKSIEVLLNWNCLGFLRWGLAALKGDDSAKELFSEIDEKYSEGIEEIRTEDVGVLNKIANGTYWQEIIKDDHFNLLIGEKNMAHKYIQEFPSNLFRGNYPVQPKYGSIPKYHMVFITRNPDAFKIMNDVMAKARAKALHAEFVEDFLFNVSPQEVRKENDFLKNEIYRFIQKNPNLLFDPEVMIGIMKITGSFGKFQNKQYTAAVRSLRKENRVFPSEGQKILPIRYVVK